MTESVDVYNNEDSLSINFENDTISYISSNLSFASIPESINNKTIFFGHLETHDDEYILYKTLLTKTKSNISHVLYPHKYHCCEFIIEILRRFFTITLRVEYLIPIQILIAFIKCVNECDYDKIDFCNFICDGDISNVQSSHELVVPREIYKLLSDTSKIKKYLCANATTDVEAKNEIYKFVNNLSKSLDIISDESLRHILYYTGKIFKHRKTIITANDHNRVRHYLYKCMRMVNSKYSNYMWDA